MKQGVLRRRLESLLGDIHGAFDPDVESRLTTVDYLIGVTRAAAFGERGVALDFECAALAIAKLEAVVNEPLLLEVRISRRRSRVRKGARDFFVEFWSRGQFVADGTSPLLSVAVGHAMRAFASGRTACS